MTRASTLPIMGGTRYFSGWRRTIKLALRVASLTPALVAASLVLDDGLIVASTIFAAAGLAAFLLTWNSIKGARERPSDYQSGPHPFPRSGL